MSGWKIWSTGAVVTAVLSFSKASWHSLSHLKTMFFYVSLVRGNTIAENLLMNFLKNCKNPRKLYTSLIVLGAGHFYTASILLGLICTPSLVISCPRKVVLLLKN